MALRQHALPHLPTKGDVERVGVLRHDCLRHVGRGARRRHALTWRRRGVRQQLYGTARRRRPAILSAALRGLHLLLVLRLPSALRRRLGLQRVGAGPVRLPLPLLLLSVWVCLTLGRGALLRNEGDGWRQRGPAFAVGDGTQPVPEGWSRSGKRARCRHKWGGY